MTAHKKLKELIRARMAKTGESYMTARRQVVGGEGHIPDVGVHPDTSALARVLGDTGIGGDHNLRDAERACDLGAVQRPRAAECDEHEIARVESLLHSARADRIGHVRVDDGENAFGGGFERQAERVSQPADDPARVINIGSIDSMQVPMLETYSYSASKAAVHQLSRHLARHLGRKQITVNTIAPGPFEAKMMAETLRNFGESIAASSPLGRIGRPDDMAGAAIFLSSRAGAYITGAIIPVDGGIATTK